MTDPFAHGAPPEIRERLVLVLDVHDLASAREWAHRLGPWFGTAKVGLELYGAVGPAAFDALHELGLAVFADLKLHDIPTQVERAAAAIARHDVEILNVHAAGGLDMVRGAARACHEHRPPVTLLAVTVLTSQTDTRAFDERLSIARDAGADGVVCSAFEIVAARAEGLRTMVPGVRLPGGDTHDQARVATPADVARFGGDWAVIGRVVTHADDPERAAAEVCASFAEGLFDAR